MVALREAALRLSREHWEVVTILLATGIELQALSRVTWREVSQEALVWTRPAPHKDVLFPLDDPDLRSAVWGFIRRPRRSADQLDRLVRQARDEASVPELEGVTALSLRLTKCAELVHSGLPAEEVSQMLALKPAIVRQATGQDLPEGAEGAAREAGGRGTPRRL